MIFKYSEYIRFLEHSKRQGRVVPLGGWEGGKAIILRHDVDLDMGAAQRLALLEAEHAIRSSFFILTTGHAYNPFSTRNRVILREMSDMGFEIGLHFDPTVYGEISDRELKDKADLEGRSLSALLGKRIQSVSLHNPSSHGRYPVFEGYKNAYEERIFSDSRYLSDSRMEFRGKDPFEFVEKVAEHPVQVLLHPMHFSEAGKGYPEILREYIRRHLAFIDEEFGVNATYSRQLPKGLLNTLLTRA